MKKETIIRAFLLAGGIMAFNEPYWIFSFVGGVLIALFVISLDK